MSSFPNNLQTQTQPLIEASLNDETDKQLVRQLAERGYEVQVGLTAEYADAIISMCHEPNIKEYCPNDSGQRFADRSAVDKWLSKNRGMFLLVKAYDRQLVGYGWAGAGTSSHVPGGQTTFAIRIGEAGQGHGLGAPFARLIVAGAAILYEARDFWLETWQSNGGAVHIYHKIGFQDVDQADDTRPTTDDGEVPDTRLYMSLPNELLAV